MRVTAVRFVGGRSVHLGLDRGPTRTRPLCGRCGSTRTTAIEAATCRRCIARAHTLGLNVEGLVLISERLRRLINAVRVVSPSAERFTTTELAVLLRYCRTTAGAVRMLRAQK